jgi:hypothetical protein
MLKPVETEAVELANEEFEPILLSTQELYDKYWEQCKPHLQRCVENINGEFTVDDIYTRALRGEIFVIIAKNDTPEIPEVRLVIALELVQYPQFNAMNVLALGGKNLRHLIKLFWKDVCGWAKICGVKHIECSVAPAMEKILSTAGFEQKYILMRQDLTEV